MLKFKGHLKTYQNFQRNFQNFWGLKTRIDIMYLKTTYIKNAIRLLRAPYSTSTTALKSRSLVIRT